MRKLLINNNDGLESATNLIVGLGNPGREYQSTRHNVGFLTIDRLSLELGIQLTRVQSQAIVGKGEFHNQQVLLAKPQTFMNDSGKAVASLIRFYKIPMKHLLVVHDDIDLPFNTIRIRPAGGSAGQRGMNSIIERIGTSDYPRLRIGVGRPTGKKAAADFVLKPFSKTEKEFLDNVLDRAVKAILVFLDSGVEAAMNQFNQSPSLE